MRRVAITGMTCFVLALARGGTARADEPVRRQLIESTHSRRLFERDIRRIASGNSAILSFELVSNREVLLLGKKPGQTSLIIWFADGTVREELYTVHRDLSMLQAVVAEISSGIICEGAPDRDAVVLRGVVPDLAHSRAAEEAVLHYLGAGGRKQGEAVPLVKAAGAAAAPGEIPATGDALQVQGAPQGIPTVINLLQLESLPSLLEERLLQAVRAIAGPDVHVRRVLKGPIADDSVDSFVLQGTVSDQTTLVRALTVAAHTLRTTGQGNANNIDDIRVFADESGGLTQLTGGGSGAGAGGASGAMGTTGLSGVGGLGGGGATLLANQVRQNIARAKVLEAARGRIVSFLEVRDLPQVRVAVRFYEVNRSKLRSFNIDFSAPGSSFRQPSLNPSALAGSLETAPVAVGSAGVNPIDWKDILSFLNNGLSDQVQVVGKRFALQTAFQLLENEGIARSLSSPSLTVLSGERANFAAGGQVPISSSFSPAFGGNAQAAAGVFNNVTFQQFGVELNIRPLIGRDDTITLDLNPQVSTPDAQLTELVRSTTGQTQGSIAFKTRSLETSTRLQDGQALLLGGLVTNDSARNAQFTPILNQIPVIEWFFKKTQATDDDLELIVVVVPTIVREKNARAALWAQQDLRELLRPSVGANAPR